MPPVKKTLKFKGVAQIEAAHKTNLVYKGKPIYVYKYHMDTARTLEKLGRVVMMEIRKNVNDYTNKEFAINILGSGLKTWCLSQDWMLFEDIPYMIEVMFDYLSDSKVNIRTLEVEYFEILVRDSIQPAPVVKFVGDDKQNDCLFVAILKCFNFNKDHLPRNCTTPEGLKKKLGLSRNNKVPIAKYPDVEKLFGIRIHQTGDYAYESNSTSSIHVFLKCEGEHVVLRSPPRDSVRPTINFNKNGTVTSIVISDSITIFDGEKTKVLTEKEHKALACNFSNVLVKVGSLETLEIGRQEYIAHATAVNKLTGGLIDKFKSAYDSKLSFNMWRNNFAKYLVEPPPLSELEQRAMYGSFHGGLRYSKPGEYENVYVYDVNKYYSHWLSSSHFMFPIAEPNYNKLTIKEFQLMLDTNVKFGLYKVILESNHKLFNYKINKSMWVTHHDIRVAKMLNVKLRIDENCINALLYDNESRISGKKTFGDYFQKCSEWLESSKGDEKMTKSIKSVANSLWGCLCSKKKVSKRVPNSELIELEHHHLNYLHRHKDFIEVKLVEKNNVFKYTWARVSLITSYARYKMVETLLSFQNIEDICYVNTDGLISTKEQPTLHVSDKIGDWSCKFYTKCHVKNGNVVIFGV